jgi:hypothetical protein
MCGRFTANFEFSDIRVRWNLDRDLPLYKPRFNVAHETSPNIPVIVRHQGGSVRVSAGAFIIRLPMEGSAAQFGINPHCMSLHS